MNLFSIPTPYPYPAPCIEDPEWHSMCGEVTGIRLTEFTARVMPNELSNIVPVLLALLFLLLIVMLIRSRDE